MILDHTTLSQRNGNASGQDATEFDGRGFHGGHAIGTWVATR